MLILQALFSLTLLLHPEALLASRESDYMTRDYGRFAITYCPEDSALATPLANVLEKRLPVIAARLRLPMPDSARFVITPTAEEWGRVTAGSPLWANGVAYPRHGVAVLKSPRFNANGGPIAETALHELVHLLLDSGAPNSELPRWLDEGLSQLFAGQQEYLDVHVLGRAAASGRLMTFWDIQGLMGMNAIDARQGYAQSLAATQELWRRFGDSGLANLVHELRRGTEIEAAFPKLYGLSYGEFEQEYRAGLRSQYGGSLWTDGELWISVLFVILVLSAGTFAYFRRKKTIAKWHAETHPDISLGTRDVPYTINYTLIRSRQEDRAESEDGQDKPPFDRPLPGN